LTCSGFSISGTFREIDNLEINIDSINVGVVMLNVHHLELFYYVAEYGGITPAVRKMPYGIQQPAVSAQIVSLENALGQRLFQRRPFVLTDAGRELHEHIAPFFRGLPGMEERLTSGHRPTLKLGASNSVLRDHLPPLLGQILSRHELLKFSFREVDQDAAESALREAELDFAVVVKERGTQAGIRSKVLLELPLALVFPPGSSLPSLPSLLKSKEPRPPLIGIPPRDRATGLFQQAMNERGLRWDIAVEASSLDVVHACVNQGLGVGLTLDLPGDSIPPHLPKLRLQGFPRLEILALWRGKPDAITAEFLALVEKAAASVKSGQAP